MEPRKVILTRDSSGYVDIWPSTAKPVKNPRGVWYAEPMGHIVGGRDCVVEAIKAIFGFTPRKGSKHLVTVNSKHKKC